MLYLIPTTLCEDAPLEMVIPLGNKEIIERIEHFIVENVRTARRFIRRLCPEKNIDLIMFYEINEHIPLETIASYLLPLEKGIDMGVLSEAGCPAIADPGTEIVRLAHTRGIEVKPLVGASSILLSLMASGLNGQNFAFNGYLPIEAMERKRKLKMLEDRALREHQTQIFIETPYRNQSLLEMILQVCRSSTMLCVAQMLTGKNENVSSQTIAQWRQKKRMLPKEPCIFLIG